MSDVRQKWRKSWEKTVVGDASNANDDYDDVDNDYEGISSQSEHLVVRLLSE